MKKEHHLSLIANNILCTRKTDYLPRCESITYHMHDAYEIYLFLDGEADFYVEGNMVTLKRGDLILISPYVFHAADSHNIQTYDRAFINISAEYLKSLSNESTDLSKCFEYYPLKMNLFHLSEDEIYILLPTIDEIINALDEPVYGSSLLIPALLTQLMVYLNKKAMSQNAQNQISGVKSTSLNSIIEFINQNITDLPPINELASQFHYNADYLSRCFKSATGLTLQHYILEKRIALAKQYLASGMAPGEVCELCGFNNYSNFSRTFRNYTGHSPRTYK